MNKQVFGNDKETIVKIVKINDTNLGYEIHTNKQVINIFINNQSDCCESWGAITTEDTLKDFNEAELLSIAIVDYDYKKHPLLKDEKDFYCEEGAAIFIDVNTCKGLLQFVLYNQHNGYYGHNVSVKSNQLHFTGCI